MNRDRRARWARQTINKTIPAILRGDASARAGVEQTKLYRDLPSAARKPAPMNPVATDDVSPTMTIHIWQTDTLTAAQALHRQQPQQQQGRDRRLAILNMASSLRPGGGVLTGAQSQEEFLCTRTTLYPALRDEFYRLPEVSVVFTRDVVIFRDAEGEDLPKLDRFRVDVATGAMLRAEDQDQDQDEEEGAGSANANANATAWAISERGRETILAKMRLLLRVLCSNQVKRVVLGAWGCGAYGNPVEDMAKLWRTVLVGGKKGRKEEWDGLEEVVFAITDSSQTSTFRRIFADVVSAQSSPY